MAATGDQVVIKGRHVDDAARTGTIIEVSGPDGTPPYRVRIADGHEALVFPGPDCVITAPAE
ncbi:MAG: hypothetical protein QOE59_5407 [Actinomycetota bacterium]|nr:hypothetical protein [Actinomycetota bacterium]